MLYLFDSYLLLLLEVVYMLVQDQVVSDTEVSMVYAYFDFHWICVYVVCNIYICLDFTSLRQGRQFNSNFYTVDDT